MSEIPTFEKRPNPVSTMDQAVVRSVAETLKRMAIAHHPEDWVPLFMRELFPLLQGTWDAAQFARLKPPEERGLHQVTGDTD